MKLSGFSIILAANLMERDGNKNSPSNEGGGDTTPPKTLITSSLEDVVVSTSFTATSTTVDIAPLSPQETYGRKRGRAEEHGGGSSSGSGQQKGKKKGELNDPPSTNPKCATCGKTFGSWKAVFGHLRSHPERDYRGAFPPPKMWEEMLRQEVVLQRRRHGQDEGSSRTEVGGNVVECTPSMPPSDRPDIEIDLNESEGEDTHKYNFPFDLNMPAPENEEDE